ncbi:hypothetical protein SAMN05428974_0606 [Sphingopyxis sp. YR583]|nr:hypothetical protein SAMN05428974_0606 [Sphingopyxis sp. YR583]
MARAETPIAVASSSAVQAARASAKILKGVLPVRARATGAAAETASTSRAASAAIAHSCRKPELADRPRITKAEIERTTAAVQDYVECMRPVLEKQRAAAEKLFSDAKAAAEASNAEATEVNALVDAYRKWEQEHQGDEG